MIKIIAESGKCVLRWDTESSVDLVEELANIASAAIEELANRNTDGKSVGQAIEKRERLYIAFEEKVRNNRVTG
mgnify:CR=1 FL=1